MPTKKKVAGPRDYAVLRDQETTNLWTIECEGLSRADALAEIQDYLENGTDYDCLKVMRLCGVSLTIEEP